MFFIDKKYSPQYYAFHRRKRIYENNKNLSDMAGFLFLLLGEKSAHGLMLLFFKKP